MKRAAVKRKKANLGAKRSAPRRRSSAKTPTLSKSRLEAAKFTKRPQTTAASRKARPPRRSVSRRATTKAVTESAGNKVAASASVSSSGEGNKVQNIEPRTVRITLAKRK